MNHPLVSYKHYYSYSLALCYSLAYPLHGLVFPISGLHLRAAAHTNVDDSSQRADDGVCFLVLLLSIPGLRLSQASRYGRRGTDVHIATNLVIVHPREEYRGMCNETLPIRIQCKDMRILCD